MLNIVDNVNDACRYIQQGKVIAYPTEAVYGLGCDPFNQQAVNEILRLKHRPVTQGLILLIADWEQLYPLIKPITEEALVPVRASWPGPTTWIFPKSERVPDWISGEHASIAIRMTAHPLAKQLCVNQPLVSTSANRRGEEPARDLKRLQLQFPSGVDAVIAGELGQESQPSAIYDVMSSKRLR